MSKNKSVPEWVRWVGFGSSITIFIIFLLVPEEWIGIGTKPDRAEIFTTVGLFILPALGAAVLSLVRKFWILLIPGVWYVSTGFLIRIELINRNLSTWSIGRNPSTWSIFLVLAATILLLTPIIAFAFEREAKNIDISDSEDKEDKA